MCRNCGLGLLLEARADLRPAATDSFIVVDSTLTVQAVSESAEQSLDVYEPDVVHRPIKELLTPANATGEGQQLIGAIIEAISGSEDLHTVYIRPANTFGVRMRARIGACGPPRAALIVLETQRPRLRPLSPVSA